MIHPFMPWLKSILTKNISFFYLEYHVSAWLWHSDVYDLRTHLYRYSVWKYTHFFISTSNFHLSGGGAKLFFKIEAQVVNCLKHLLSFLDNKWAQPIEISQTLSNFQLTDLHFNEKVAYERDGRLGWCF